MATPTEKTTDTPTTADHIAAATKMVAAAMDAEKAGTAAFLHLSRARNALAAAQAATPPAA